MWRNMHVTCNKCYSQIRSLTEFEEAARVTAATSSMRESTRRSGFLSANWLALEHHAHTILTCLRDFSRFQSAGGAYLQQNKQIQRFSRCVLFVCVYVCMCVCLAKMGFRYPPATSAPQRGGGDAFAPATGFWVCRCCISGCDPTHNPLIRTRSNNQSGLPVRKQLFQHDSSDKYND